MSKPYLKLPALIKTPYYQKVLRTQRDYLLAYWPVWEASGSVGNDISGNARHGAYTGVDLGHPGIGDGHTCPWFDGVNDCVNVYSTSLRDAFNGDEITIFQWIKAVDWGDSMTRRLLQFLGTSEIYIQHGVDNSLYFIRASGGNVGISLPGFIDTGWVPLAITASVSGNVLRAYARGVQEGADQTGLNAWVGTLGATTAVIGAYNSGSMFPAHGWLGPAAIWSIALTPTEIARISTV